MISPEQFNDWLDDITGLVAKGEEPASEELPSFIEHPLLISILLEKIVSVDEAALGEDQSAFSAYLFVFDACVSQLKFAMESGNRRAQQTMESLMNELVLVIQKSEKTINFWLPLMSVFYDAQVPLSDTLQSIYLMLAEEESEKFELEDFDHVASMRELILELGDLSPFELAAHFFAQSHAMPPEFFGDLVIDLASIEEAEEATILMLLHPNKATREMTILALDNVMPSLTLSSDSLARLQAIQAWLPKEEHGTLERWIREQRKRGVLFPKPEPKEVLKLQASEIDGGGAEGLFLQLKADKRIRLSGVLVKTGFGLKDAWMTPTITQTEAKRYYQQVFEDGVTLRGVDLPYFMQITNHFLAETLSHGDMPNLYFLELQEALGVHFLPELINIDETIDALSVQIQPFTQQVVERALHHTENWLEEKTFASSWFIESEQVDKLVNRCSSFDNGVKVCRFDEAMDSIFDQILEPNRAHWIFHFLWVALWLRASARKHEKVWQDAFLVAYAIHSDVPLKEVPIMRAVCHQSIINSVETMRERRTYLSQE